VIPLHLVNQVRVLQPRWHDRVILPRVDKFKPGANIITIEHQNWPSKYYMHSKTAAQYPTETKKGKWGEYKVYVIPLDELTTVQERNEIVKTVREIF
jgi:hypothetical protein